MNNLFNEKILNKKAGEEVNLDKNNLRERRKYLDKWIDNLDNGTLNNPKYITKYIMENSIKNWVEMII